MVAVAYLIPLTLRAQDTSARREPAEVWREHMQKLAQTLTDAFPFFNSRSDFALVSHSCLIAPPAWQFANSLNAGTFDGNARSD